jgi:hypothetical protein
MSYLSLCYALVARGLEVHGIEASERLVARLRAKPEATSITVTIGDISAFEPDGEFALIYAIYDTFSMLRSQQDQLSRFRMVSAHLRRGGFFVIEQKNPVRLLDALRCRCLRAKGTPCGWRRRGTTRSRSRSSRHRFRSGGMRRVCIQCEDVTPGRRNWT